MNEQRWNLTLAALLGEPLPALPAIRGQRHHCTDAPLSAQELEDIEGPSELALVAGISRQAAQVRITRRKRRAPACSTDNPERTPHAR